jgi:two-component sensor histidine kinase
MSTVKERLFDLIPFIVISAVLLVSQSIDLMVLHYVAGLIVALLGILVFVTAAFQKNPRTDTGFWIIAAASLFVAVAELLHTVSYNGTELYATLGANVSIQFRVVARLLLSVSSLAGVLLVGTSVRRWRVFLVVGTISVLLIASVYPLRVFPTVYMEGWGLTPFKHITEKLIVVALSLSGVLVFFRRGLFPKDSWIWFAVAFALATITEMVMTGHYDVEFAPSIIALHFLSASSFALYRGFLLIEIESPRQALQSELQLHKDQVSEREMLLREAHHRVKNNLGLIRSIVNLLISTSEAIGKDTLLDLVARISAVEKIHDALYRAESATSDVFIDEYLSSVATELVSSLAAAPVTLDVNLPHVLYASRDATALGILSAEIITNALKYGVPEGGTIRITGTATTGVITIVYSNDGLPFRPGRRGLGTELIETLVRQLDGSMELNTDGETRYTLVLPAGKRTR